MPPKALKRMEHHVRSQAHAEPKVLYGPFTRSDRLGPQGEGITRTATKAGSYHTNFEIAEGDDVGATSTKKRLTEETDSLEGDIAAQRWPSWDRFHSQDLQASELKNKVDWSSTSLWYLPSSKTSSSVPLPHERASSAVPPASNNDGSLLAPVSSSYSSTSSLFISQTPSRLSNPVPGFSSKMIELAIIGSGGEGDCILYKDRFTSKLFVCKALVHKRSIQICNGVPEIVLIHDILGSYDRVLALLAWERRTVTGTLRLWHPYYDRGDLFDLLETYHSKHQIRLPEAFIWHAFIQLAEALAYIHEGYNRHHPHSLSRPLGFRSIIHRDIKPENVFLQSSNGTSAGAYPSIILADLGLATTRPHSSEHVGTAAFQGPELPRCSKAGDLWSLGAVIHMLCSGAPPLRPKPAYDYIPGRRFRRMGTLEWEETPRARLTGKEVLVNREGYSWEMEEALRLVLRWKGDERVGGKELIERLKAGERGWMESGGRVVKMKEWTSKAERKACLKGEGHQI
ncbi:MAG: hypothetical protein Q9167_001435 [Letrouitia subvulpina]